MTIYYMDGFDSYANATQLDQNTRLTQVGSPTILSSADAYKNIGRCLRLSYSDYIYHTFDSAVTTAVVGCHVKVPTTCENMIQFCDSLNNYHCTVEVYYTGEIRLVDSTNATKDTITGVYSPSNWFHIEVKLVLNSSVTVKVNGAQVLYDNTGDYQSGTAQIERMRLVCNDNSNPLFDNLFIADDWQGQLEMITLVPTSDGTHTDFSPSTGSDHYAVVDEETALDTDYNEATALGDKDTYQITPSGIATPIKAVSVFNRVFKEGSSTAGVKNILRAGSTDYQGSSDERILTSDAEMITDIWEVNPNTSSAWTTSDLSSMEFGVEVTTLTTTTTV